ncbi:hypothetical protein H8M44_18285 [Klebsiella pneumoniae]|nr:hypothetical protein [Klebsiella pneumoniae]
MSGFQVFNSAGAMTINSENKGTVASLYNPMPSLTDIGFYRIDSIFGNGSTLGFLPPSFYPTNGGLRWFRLTVDGRYCFPGASMFEPGTGDFMISSSAVGIQSGYLDVFDGGGNLVWSAVSAGSMPRIRSFLTIPPGHDLSSAITFNTSFDSPWICIGQCPGNLSDDGTATGYSGIMIRRNSSTSYTLQYINKNQLSYLSMMGSNQLQIALASFTGY